MHLGDEKVFRPLKSRVIERRTPSTAFSHKSPASEEKVSRRKYPSERPFSAEMFNPRHQTRFSSQEYAKEASDPYCASPQRGLSEDYNSPVGRQAASYPRGRVGDTKATRPVPINLTAALFNKLDLNHDGFIDREEFRKAFASKNPNAIPNSFTSLNDFSDIPPNYPNPKPESATYPAAPKSPKVPAYYPEGESFRTSHTSPSFLETKAEVFGCREDEADFKFSGLPSHYPAARREGEGANNFGGAPAWGKSGKARGAFEGIEKHGGKGDAKEPVHFHGPETSLARSKPSSSSRSNSNTPSYFLIRNAGSEPHPSHSPNNISQSPNRNPGSESYPVDQLEPNQSKSNKPNSTIVNPISEPISGNQPKNNLQQKSIQNPGLEPKPAVPVDGLLRPSARGGVGRDGYRPENPTEANPKGMEEKEGFVAPLKSEEANRKESALDAKISYEHLGPIEGSHAKDGSPNFASNSPQSQPQSQPLPLPQSESKPESQRQPQPPQTPPHSQQENIPSFSAPPNPRLGERYSMRNTPGPNTGVSTNVKGLKKTLQFEDKNQEVKSTSSKKSIEVKDSSGGSKAGNMKAFEFGNIDETDDMEGVLANVFKKQLELERELEMSRIRLARLPSFKLILAFNQLDPKKNGFVTRAELGTILRKSGHAMPNKELCMLVKGFDWSKDTHLSYSDFLKKMMPRDRKYCDIVTDPIVDDDESLSAMATSEFSRFFVDLLEIEKALQQIRIWFTETMRMRPDLNLHRTVGKLDEYNNGKLGFGQLRRFLAKMGVYATESDAGALMSRYDKDNKGSITYLDFLDELFVKY
ncbi:hypothetical protein AAMO2058_000272800 [Amorphochlora amoebiformis]